MSKKIRMRNEAEACYGESQEVVAELLKYSLSLPSSFFNIILKQPTLNKSMTGQKSQGWRKITNQHVQKCYLQVIQFL